MTMIKHFLKDGTSVETVDGTVIEKEEIYEIIKRINERKKDEKNFDEYDHNNHVCGTSGVFIRN